jgi:hypothetical protein
MAPRRTSTDNDEIIRTFDLAHAPIELQACLEAQHLVDTSSRNPRALQVWMGSKTLALKPPPEGRSVTQVTAWEFYLYRWLTRLGLAPGQTAYVVWSHSTHTVSGGNHLLADREAPYRPDAVQPQPFSDIVRQDSVVDKATRRTNEKSSFHRLIYQSRSTLDGQPVLQLEALRDILFWAKRRNEDLGVSGILLYNQLDYLQVLEGVWTRVDLIFRSVLCDKRHTNIVILQRGPVDGRIFHSWSMAYKELPHGTTWPEYSIYDFPTQLLAGNLDMTPGCLAGSRHSQ